MKLSEKHFTGREIKNFEKVVSQEGRFLKKETTGIGEPRTRNGMRRRPGRARRVQVARQALR